MPQASPVTLHPSPSLARTFQRQGHRQVERSCDAVRQRSVDGAFIPTPLLARRRSRLLRGTCQAYRLLASQRPHRAVETLAVATARISFARVETRSTPNGATLRRRSMRLSHGTRNRATTRISHRGAAFRRRSRRGFRRVSQRESCDRIERDCTSAHGKARRRTRWHTNAWRKTWTVNHRHRKAMQWTPRSSGASAQVASAVDALLKSNGAVERLVV